MKLEEGKWYKWYQKNHDSIHIGKYFNYPDEGFVKMKPWIVRSIQYDKEGTFDSKFMQDIVEVTDLTEIQKLLPDCHEDKVKPASAILGAEATKGFLLPKSERYLVTMKFFNELKEPERSEAIENYDENRYGIPSKLNNALTNGFDWGKSKQGYKYWNDIRDSIEDNTYFKEQEVFGKYKIGDIVVSLTDFKPRCAGGIYKVLKGSHDNVLFYLSTTNSSDADDWRLATSKEAEAYNNGIINIADIKPTSLEGRYIKCLKKNNWNDGKTKVGDILKIRKSDSVGDLFIGLECLDNSRLKNGEFELLPIDYTPEPVKEEQTMFKKGDYIVTLVNDGDCGKVNYCIKQNQDNKDLYPEIDTKNIKGNGSTTFTFSDKSGLKWRFATKEEGEEYERQGKPYNVTNLLSSLILNDSSGLITRDVSILSTSTFYGNTPHSYPLTPKEAYPNYSLPVPTNIILKTKSKSIKL